MTDTPQPQENAALIEKAFGAGWTAALSGRSYQLALDACLVALSAAPPAQPHPETPQGDGYNMDEAEKARWASFRTEATAAARKLRDIDRAHVDGKMDESIHDGLLEAADLLDIFGRPIVVMTASQPPPEALRAEVLERAIRIVESEEELDGPMPEENRRLAEQLGPEAHARAVVRSTKRSIARRLRALSASPAPHTERTT